MALCLAGRRELVKSQRGPLVFIFGAGCLIAAGSYGRIYAGEEAAAANMTLSSLSMQHLT